MKCKDYMSSKFPRSSSKNLQKRDKKNGEPWKLTSHPRPQRGHPPSLGKQGTNGCTPSHSHIMQTITTQFNTIQYNPSQGLHIDSTIESRYRVKVGSLHEENFKSMNHIYSHILISNMPFQGLTMSSLFIHLLIPPKNARTMKSIPIEKRQESSPRMGEFLNYMGEPN